MLNHKALMFPTLGTLGRASLVFLHFLRWFESHGWMDGWMEKDASQIVISPIVIEILSSCMNPGCVDKSPSYVYIYLYIDIYLYI